MLLKCVRITLLSADSSAQVLGFSSCILHFLMCAQLNIIFYYVSCSQRQPAKLLNAHAKFQPTPAFNNSLMGYILTNQYYVSFVTL